MGNKPLTQLLLSSVHYQHQHGEMVPPPVAMIKGNWVAYCVLGNTVYTRLSDGKIING